jgi:hypothetical protein
VPKALFGFWSAETSKTLLEAIDAAADVQSLLLTGVERVAFGADVQAQWLAQSGAGLDDVTAGAGGVNGFVRWMNISFHGYFLGLGMPPLNTIVEYRTQLGRAYYQTLRWTQVIALTDGRLLASASTAFNGGAGAAREEA